MNILRKAVTELCNKLENPMVASKNKADYLNLITAIDEQTREMLKDFSYDLFDKELYKDFSVPSVPFSDEYLEGVEHNRDAVRDSIIATYAYRLNIKNHLLNDFGINLNNISTIAFTNINFCVSVLSNEINKFQKEILERDFGFDIREDSEGIIEFPYNDTNVNAFYKYFKKHLCRVSLKFTVSNDCIESIKITALGGKVQFSDVREIPNSEYFLQSEIYYLQQYADLMNEGLSSCDNKKIDITLMRYFVSNVILFESRIDTDLPIYMAFKKVFDTSHISTLNNKILAIANDVIKEDSFLLNSQNIIVESINEKIKDLMLECDDIGFSDDKFYFRLDKKMVMNDVYGNFVMLSESAGEPYEKLKNTITKIFPSAKIKNCIMDDECVNVVSSAVIIDNIMDLNIL